jgi:hypothetical protein
LLFHPQKEKQMKLPVLKTVDGEKRESVDCDNGSHCAKCVLFEKNGGRCEGCTPKQRQAMVGHNFGEYCYQECHSCTGYKANITAVCCRSPLKNIYMDAVSGNPDNWNEPHYDFTEREQLKFDRKAVFYFNYGSAMRITDGGKKGNLVDHEVMAVSLKEVKAMGGTFVSKDMHDYLCVSKKTKLILTTMVIDDHLERAWENTWYERQAEECTKVGFHAWMPLAFSAYAHEAKMHAYYQFLRTMRCTELSQAHFLAGYYATSPGFRLVDLVQRALEKIPQVMFNTQLMTNDVNVIKDQLVGFQQWHELAPAHTAFWFVGAVTPTWVHNLRKVCGSRDLYFVSGKPLYLAVHGKRMKPDGLEKKLLDHERPDKLELIHDNYAVFEHLVNTYAKLPPKAKKEKR